MNNLRKGNTDVSQSFPLASLKIMRIVRLIRLIRFMKLYKALQEKKRKKHFEKVLNINRLIRESVAILKIEHRKTLFSNIDNELEMEREKSEKLKEEREKLLLKETRIGKKILEKTVKRTIFLVLILVFCGPLFSSSFFYNKDNKGYLANLHILANLSENQVDSSSILRLYQLYTLNQSTTDFPLIYCNLPSINATYETVNLNDLREEEKMTKILYVTPYTAGFQATIDIRKFTMLNSIMNILTTIYIALVLLVTCYMFQKDLHQYVIDPLTRMTLKINKIANNPLASKENYNFEKKVAIYETQQIEESIEKIGILLALGFGEAGSFIISQNISSEGDLVATLPGSKTFGIFGFCDIRNFTDTTEILQEEVMVFVNNIADVVHSLVNRYGGSANKNIGDAFLLVWKFPKTEIEDDQGELKLKKTRTVKNITDLALIAFLKIICAINQEPKFLKYRSHPKLNERIHNYQIKMGFGLHIGWAIEGSIGSEFKIDASYLSPNVNMAARLEAATKQYRSLLLISNGFVEYASKGTKRYCREIDRVTVKGSNEPIGIFTVDLDLKDLENSNMTSGIENRKLSSLDRKFFKERALNIFEKMHKYLECDKQLSLTLKGCKGEFKNLFEKGFEKYIGGQWREAKTIFEKGLEMRKEDGPSAVLLGVMDDHQFVAPDNWMGYRALTEK